ncbi:pilus assembly protein TadG [Caulobacter vibrioides]|uniref:ubiquitin-activating E1 FCCH domain-containing protein n=1 Tax=Caulobacter vibrioides TaxID=155892 RepID=UPI000BB498EB|nr:ubiquitin-activating E1 FCCH domain-containing protein [Caulobacter vibrioides]ATC23212.1 pilus assembly protein TadG [Caulobacter vibrioides]AZH11421.1 pilus assembly protein TadG [Caulobacter vibrioides]PLR13116.1 pilus assembly protein TadG [Caulobacter vibrioides]
MPTKSRFLRRLREGVAAFARRLRRDDRGAIAIQFALLALPLSILLFGLLDVGRLSLQRRQMQDALDAATLMAARSTATSSADLDTTGDAAFLAEIAGMNLGLTASSSTFSAGTNNRVIGTATATLRPIIANLWQSGNFTVTASSEVVRASKNLEIALVLDITGSMGNGTRIADLKVAAADLVDVLVRDTQTPFYSKMALVPYSAGVNVGATYADAVRGPVPVKTITGAAWASGSARSITGITRANPAVVTASGHGLSTGDYVYITGVRGMTSVNDKIYRVTRSDPDKVSLNSTNTSSASNYTNGGTIQKCLTSTCQVVITTSTSHGFTTGDEIRFAGMSGLTSLNGTTRTITVLTNTTFDSSLTGPGSSTYSSGGTATCEESTVPGCEKIRFTNADGYERVNSQSTCATERIGSQAYTDAAPSTAYVGSHYPTAGSSSSTVCPTATITPLSTDKTALKAQINGLTVGGATAGHIGLAWGWYMVAPNFGYLWPNASQRPAAYKARDLMKVVILMTDGGFNMTYCNSVVARNIGSGTNIGDDERINCDATNGSSFDQAAELCDSIKASANDITLYTVGFTVGNDQTARNFLTNCASSTDKAYFPATGHELKASFQAIAQEISNLRISK